MVIFRFLQLIVINYFRIIFLVSVIGKILYPTSFVSYTISFFQVIGISSLFYYIDFNLLTAPLLGTIIVVEIFILFFSFQDKMKFKKIGVIFFIAMFFVSFMGWYLKIPGDCGCFGKILTFSNDLYKVFFNFFNLVLIVFPLKKFSASLKTRTHQIRY